MKRLFYLVLTALIVLLTGCKKDTGDPTPPEKVEVREVNLSKSALTLTVGASETLTATVLPANAADKKLTWSSDSPSVAKVDDGVVSALAVGSAKITATAGAKSAFCTVTVKEVKVESLSLDKQELTLTEGSEITLVATLTPENATNKTVTWESGKPAVATVDQAGKVKALVPGETVITAKAGEKSATCKVTVEKLTVPVESVSLDKGQAEIIIGETLQLKATVAPQDATDKSLTWSSSQEAVATVDQNGKVSAVAVGVTTVTVTTTEGKKTATCVVKVTVGPITAIRIEPASLTLKTGQEAQLALEFTPANSSDSKEVDWASYNTSIATVSAEGRVRGIAEGEVDIEVRLKSDHAVKAKCRVKVEKDASLKGIAFGASVKDLKVGEVSKLEVIYTPEYAENKTIKSWTSSQPAVAAVSDDGTVTALAIGQTLITATSLEGDFTAVCAVNVLEKGVDVYALLGQRPYKNFERIMPNIYDNFYGIEMENGVLYTSDSRRVSKNEEVLCSLPHYAANFCVKNGVVYAIANSDQRYVKVLYKILPDGKYSVMDIPLTGTERSFYEIEVNAEGTCFLLGTERNIYNDHETKLWKITANGTVTETNYQEKFAPDYANLALDDQGNARISAGVTVWPERRYELYKNGVLQTSSEYIKDLQDTQIGFHGKDRYLAYATLNQVVVMKNEVVVSTLSFDGTPMLVEMEISSQGDVYLALNVGSSAVFYKNNNLLYKANSMIVSRMSISE